MDFTPDPEHETIREAVRRVCADFPDAYWREKDEAHEFPWEFYKAFAGGGWLGIAMPEEYGGGGRGITEAAIVLGEVANSGAGMNGASALHLTVFGLNPLVCHGSEEMKERYLPAAAAGDLQVAFGVTEPDAGTDTPSITTFARRVDGGYVVRGRKVWTSKALESEKVLLLVRTTPLSECARRTDGMTLFLADLDRDHVDIRPIPKLGRNAVDSNEVVYDDLPVSEADRIGEEGKGFWYLLDGLNPERILIASEAVGIGRAALRRAVAYANERIVFGRPIGKNQGIAFPLAQAHAHLEAAELMVWRAAWLYDHGLPCGAEANMAKLLAADAGFEAADRALQTHGGFGYAKEFDVERYWREVRLMKIAPVSQEMVLNYLCEHVLRLPRSY